MAILSFPQSLQPASRPAAAVARHRERALRYFTAPQIKLIRRTARDRAALALARGQVTAPREWALIDVLTSTGLRAGEASNLRVGDIRAGYGESSVFVRDGKGHKSRVIQIPASLTTHLRSYILWKQSIGEPCAADDYLFIGQRGPWSPWAIGQVIKQTLRRIGLYERGKSAHSLRHSYAVEVYRQKRDIRCVQKQLGHSSIATTQIYADCLPEDIAEQVRGLWGTV